MKQTKSALNWISRLLKRQKITFIIFGGFAAKVYGSNRELADIDIGITHKQLNKIIPHINKYTLRKLKIYRDMNWNAPVITLMYKGQEIDIISIEKTKIFNKITRKWQNIKPYFKNPKKIKYLSANILVIQKNKLISYKRKLLRRVDIADIKQLTNGTFKP